MDVGEDGGASSSARTLEDMRNVTLSSIAKLVNGTVLPQVLESIKHYSELKEREVFGPLEEDPEYKLIVQANNLSVEIDNEISVIHKYLRDAYAKRFPELEQLVREPIDYVRTVELLQNELDTGQAALKAILPPATVMVVSVAASTTQGEELSAEELVKVNEACAMVVKLCEAKQAIFDYVQSKMYFLAPNVTHVCGASAAAKLLGIAGGLTALSKIPASNIMLLGAQKRTSTGFSNANALPHTGCIFYSDIVQSQPADYRRKCARLVSAKIALAARVDSYRDRNGPQGATVGIELREEIQKKMDKAMEPPPSRAIKALPKPDDPHRKKRGGKRVRRMADKYGKTELHKQANRMGFADYQEDMLQEEMGFDTGMVGKSNSFRVVEAKQKGTLSKRLQRELNKPVNRPGTMSAIKGSRSAVSGTSTVSFTPVQGLEITTPHLNKPKSAESDKYFGTATTFRNIGSAPGML